ncbi:MAG: pyridoxamine 5'-phosphate oxidase family protein [Opitutae bacterium]|nr:pyridoxamine 5'-phosphate oxidase family protein [Opitutae bacterium]
MAHHFRESLFTADVLRAQEAYYGRAQSLPPAPGADELGAPEEAFISRRDSFYLASVNTAGWPYIQHRGGPRGFLKVLDGHTLAFADLSGNRQLLTTGNVATNDRVALFLMDYPRRERLKIIGHAEIIPAAANPAHAAEFAPEGVPVRKVERVFRVRVTGYDWNCPQYITPRFTADEIAQTAAPLHARIAELEAALAAARRASPVR